MDYGLFVALQVVVLAALPYGCYLLARAKTKAFAARLRLRRIAEGLLWVYYGLTFLSVALDFYFHAQTGLWAKPYMLGLSCLPVAPFVAMAIVGIAWKVRSTTLNEEAPR